MTDASTVPDFTVVSEPPFWQTPKIGGIAVAANDQYRPPPKTLLFCHTHPVNRLGNLNKLIISSFLNQLIDLNDEINIIGMSDTKTTDLIRLLSVLVNL